MSYSALIIDDDVWMQRILSTTLVDYGFTKSYLASDGYEGVALAVEHTPTLIVLDILMPELTGHTTLKILKKIKVTKDIPVLMVSALADVENLTKAIKIGTTAFITKPFTKMTIQGKLIDIFGKKKMEQIRSGKPIETESDLFYNSIRTNVDLFDNPLIDHEEVDIPEYESSFDAANSTSSNADAEKKEPKKLNLTQRYTTTEQQSIESIKKLLLKNKK
jgi:CheY-like chemotaxis protein